ncbi:MAG TPA: pitrilysin family protein [Candidatus Acidoferrales bacterium]|nr:pitrilysin family protein [Candidatus Acidoferrales bacterium]
MSAIRAGLVLLLLPLAPAAQDVNRFEKRVTEFTLANGLRFLVLERHGTPVVSFHTYVRAGSADDPAGQTGMAYLLDHVLFNGTDAIGSRNWAEERKALDVVEETYGRLQSERNLGPKADQNRIDMLETRMRLAIDAADRLGMPEAYTAELEESGGAVGSHNATADATECSYSLPSNLIELWFLMESQRLQRPALRSFYGTRNALAEDWRKWLAGSPQPQLFGVLLGSAFLAHPYRHPLGGWPGDMSSLSRTEARAFFEKYYVPGNVVMTLVGDANPGEVKALASKYFGTWPARPVPPLVPTREPQQAGPKMVAIESTTPGHMLIGYKRPDQFDKDDPVFDVVQILLTQGRSGLLYEELVGNRHVAQAVEGASSMPAGRYPNLFLLRLTAAQGHSVEENQQALDEFLNRLKVQAMDAVTLARGRAQARSIVLNRLMTNAGMAAMLGSYESNYGDWRKLFTELDQLNRITAEDIQRVLVKYFVPSGRTVAYTVLPGQAGLPARRSSGGIEKR